MLQRNAREEFEQARHELDLKVTRAVPLSFVIEKYLQHHRTSYISTLFMQLVARLLLVGRDSLNQVTDRFIKTAAKISNDVQNSRNDRK